MIVLYKKEDMEDEYFLSKELKHIARLFERGMITKAEMIEMGEDLFREYKIYKGV